jgi:hypothetical protein
MTAVERRYLLTHDLLLLSGSRVAALKGWRRGQISELMRPRRDPAGQGGHRSPKALLRDLGEHRVLRANAGLIQSMALHRSH